MNLRQHAQLPESPDGMFRVLLSQNEFQLMPRTVGAYGSQHGDVSLEQSGGLWLEAEAQPLLVADSSQDSGGVVAKTPAVQDADQAVLEVHLALIGVD